MQQELGGDLAVQPQLRDLPGQRMGARLALAAGLRVIAEQHDRGEAVVELLDHAERVAAPAADQPGAVRQAGGDDVAAGGVRVLDQDVGRAGGDSALAGRDHLAGHLLAELGIGRLRLARLLPVGDARDPFDVVADIDLHASPRAMAPKAASWTPSMASSSGRGCDDSLAITTSVVGSTKMNCPWMPMAQKAPWSSPT